MPVSFINIKTVSVSTTSNNVKVTVSSTVGLH